MSGVTRSTVIREMHASTATHEQSSSSIRRFTSPPSATMCSKLATAPEDHSVPLLMARVSPYNQCIYMTVLSVLEFIIPLKPPLYYCSIDLYSLCTEELTAPRDLTDEPMITTPSPVMVSSSSIHKAPACVVTA